MKGKSDMQFTLVAYYGEKPYNFGTIIESCQGFITEEGCLNKDFKKYDMEQVHGTIIGLAGTKQSGQIINNNSGLVMDLDQVLAFIKSTFETPIKIRVGGFDNGTDYGFKSRDKSPYERSFSIRGDGIVVVMGWPIGTYGGFPKSLQEIRDNFGQKVNVKHQYANDNDFYFRLGQIEKIDDIQKQNREAVEEKVREYLSKNPIEFDIDLTNLYIVAYKDNKLPITTSYALDVSSVKAQWMESLYPSLTDELLCEILSEIKKVNEKLEKK